MLELSCCNGTKALELEFRALSACLLKAEEALAVKPARVAPMAYEADGCWRLAARRRRLATIPKIAPIIPMAAITPTTAPTMTPVFEDEPLVDWVPWPLPCAAAF